MTNKVSGYSLFMLVVAIAAMGTVIVGGVLSYLGELRNQF